MIVIITTLHKKEDAVRIGKGLLDKKLIACYNLWPIESAYWWRGEILEESETMMLLKARAGKFEAVADYIKEESGYEVPDIFSFQPEKVAPGFDEWIDEATL